MSRGKPLILLYNKEEKPTRKVIKIYQEYFENMLKYIIQILLKCGTLKIVKEQRTARKG